MKTRYEAYIDGIPLSDVSDKIITLDIQETAADSDISTSDHVYFAGTAYHGTRRRSISVVVAFEIHEYSIQRRKEICSQVAKWARGTWLTINDRPDQRLRVHPAVLPVVSGSLDWTAALSVTFTAYEWPYWEFAQATSVATSASADIHVPGTAEHALCAVDVKNTGTKAVTSVTVGAGDTQMQFDGISLPAGKTLVIDFDDAYRLRAMIDGVSVLKRRTAQSDDRLIVRCMERQNVSVTASSAVTATFKARGCNE